MKRRRLNERTGGFLGMERKFHDIDSGLEMVGVTWVSVDPTIPDTLNGVPQGDGESERDGKNYVVDSLHIRGQIVLPKDEENSNPQPDTVMRIVVVLDTQANGAVLDPAKVLSIAGSQNVYAFRNLQYTSRYKVFYDQKFLLRINNMNEGAINSFAHGQQTALFDVNLTFTPPIQVTTNGTTSSVSVIVDNALHIMAISTASDAEIRYKSRIRFRG